MDSGVFHHKVSKMYGEKERILEEEKAVVVIIRGAIGGSLPKGFDFVYYIYYIPGGRGGKLLWHFIFF